MAKEAYIEIDGKRTPLTIEQMKALGIYEEPKKSPFDIVEKGEYYYLINSRGKLESIKDFYWDNDKKRYDVANYCTDKELMQQRAWHETLNRLLWRFSIENDDSKINWNNIDQRKYLIYFDNKLKKFSIAEYRYMKFDGCIFFYSKSIAQKAIDEIVRPFMKEHPDFIW